jgi:hypothetical protein
MTDYAPDPKLEQVYRNLQNLKLSTVSANDIEKLTDPTFLQATNQNALLTYNIINSAAMRDGGPMPQTSKVVSTGQLSDTGTVVAFRPAFGEVWQLMAMSLDPDGTNAAHRGIGYIVDFSTLTNPADPTNLSGANIVEIFDSSLSTSAESLTYDTPLFLDNNTFFALNVVTLDTGAGDTLGLKIACIRVR